MMTAATAPPVHNSLPSRSPGEGGAAAATAAAAAVIFLPVTAGLARQWYDDPNATYGFLVAAAALVATRQRWPRLRVAPRQGSWWGGGALAGAAALYVAATLAADVFLLRASCVALSAAAVWFVCGSAHLRLLGAPLMLALAAIPPPGALVTQVTMPLQLAASQLATVLLRLMGLDVLRDGNVLTLTHVTLEVAEACSGMRSVVTLLALVAVYGATSGAARWRVLLLAVATVPVALAGNGLRVAATAVLALRLGEDATRGAVHDATGFAAFAAMCGALAAVHLLASSLPRRSPEAAV
jgi:exosortase